MNKFKRAVESLEEIQSSFPRTWNQPIKLHTRTSELFAKTAQRKPLAPGCAECETTFDLSLLMSDF